MLSSTVIILSILLKQRKQQGKIVKKKRLRRYRVHPFNAERLLYGQFNTHFQRLRNYPKKFFTVFRMSLQSFDELLTLLKHELTKTGNRRGDGICAAQRLTLTLRYLATGKSFEDLSMDYMLGRSTVNCIVRETCQLIWSKLHSIEIPMPTRNMWLQKADDFYANSQFPNCIGAIDGKHVRLINPRKCGSLYYNYKKYSSVVLLAVADANYCFTTIDVGAYGREGDSQIFKRSNLGIRLRNNTLDIPVDRTLPNTDNNEPLPFVLLGDEAFGLQNNLMRPYPANSGLDHDKKVFNYRLSRARRFVECTFGIFSHKWRIFENALLVQPDFAIDIIKAACVLHNFVRKRDGYEYHQTLVNAMPTTSRLGTTRNRQALSIRNKFSQYFTSAAGSLPWQNRFI